MASVELDLTAAQRVLDYAVELAGWDDDVDEETVDALRVVAVGLGVDPDSATPGRHKCRYAGHKWGIWLVTAAAKRAARTCSVCYRCEDMTTATPAAE